MTKKTIKTKAVGVLLALGIMTGMGVATAPVAQAYTDHYHYWQYNCPWPSRYLYAYRDYNWWEETFQWKRDGWVIVRTESWNCYVW